MKKRLSLLAALVPLMLYSASTSASSNGFAFGVIAHAMTPSADESALVDAIRESDPENLAFVVVNGIKHASEPCSDLLYAKRKTLLQGAKHGLIVSSAGSDWVSCKDKNGRSTAVGKLNRLRELFFGDEFSFGDTKLPLIRQSITPKFRSFVENARWDIGDIAFAAINVPAENNHYVFAAGRNGEFEDRLVANRDWIRRIFVHATRRRLEGIVIFSDANMLALHPGRQRNGFAEIRKEVISRAAKFPGKVLLIHGQPVKPDGSDTITWNRNLGQVGVARGWLKVKIIPSDPALFSLAKEQREK